jgi:hypothetical protein
MHAFDDPGFSSIARPVETQAPPLPRQDFLGFAHAIVIDTSAVFDAPRLGHENGMDAVKEFLQVKSVWLISGATANNPFVLR